MNILQKIMDSKEESLSIDPVRLQGCFLALQDKLRAYLEASQPSLVWNNEKIEAVNLQVSDLVKAHENNALYYGLGEPGPEKNAIVTVDAEIAHVVSHFALVGPDIPDMRGSSSLPLAQLDLLLLTDLIDEIVEYFSDESRVGENPLWSKWECKSALNYAQFILPSGIDYWLQVVLNFEAKPPPAVDTLEETAETKTLDSSSDDTEGKELKSSENTKISAHWPQVYAVRILMPKSIFETYMSEVIVHKVSPEMLQQESLSENWAYRVSSTQTRLRSVLESCRMSVADCTRLEIGQVLPLPGASLDSIKIEAEFGSQRQVIMEGVMGVHKTHKAIRLNSDIDPDFTADVLEI